MIICFTGTGNSRKVADKLRDILGDEIVRPAPGLMRDPSKIRLDVTDGRIIWVFPVHSWGMSRLIKSTILKSTLNSPSHLKHYMVCTCGDDVGLTDKQWRKYIRRRKWEDVGAFSVQMPNTYTCLPRFDVDSPQLEKSKLEATAARIEHIADEIRAEKKMTDVVRGSFPWVKTRLIHPLFMRFMTRTKPFHYTHDCNGCGKCAQNCPTNVIMMVDGHPKWTLKHCTMCLRCYHYCPKHAIGYGAATNGKGQYHCPGYNLK